MSRPDLARRLAAEALGTFCLVFAGTGAVVVNAVAGNPLGHGGVAAAFGLVVAIMIFGLGHLSGAHINPAVTVAFAAARHFPAREAVPYVIAQLAGAILASLALRGLFGLAGDLGVTQPDHVGLLGALVLEAGLSAVLMIVILAVATDTRAVGSMAAIAIGAPIALEALVMGPITGASMNPARSLAPALVSGNLTDLWIYLVGPVAGALAGAAVYAFLRGTHVAVGVAPPAALIEQEEPAR
jgi:MIP family channel proteins